MSYSGEHGTVTIEESQLNDADCLVFKNKEQFIACSLLHMSRGIYVTASLSHYHSLSNSLIATE